MKPFNTGKLTVVWRARRGGRGYLPVQNRMMSVRPISSVLAQRPSMSSQNRRSLLRWSSRWTLRPYYIAWNAAYQVNKTE